MITGYVPQNHLVQIAYPLVGFLPGDGVADVHCPARLRTVFPAHFRTGRIHHPARSRQRRCVAPETASRRFLPDACFDLDRHGLTGEKIRPSCHRFTSRNTISNWLRPRCPPTGQHWRYISPSAVAEYPGSRQDRGNQHYFSSGRRNPSGNPCASLARRSHLALLCPRLGHNTNYRQVNAIVGIMSPDDTRL